MAQFESHLSRNDNGETASLFHKYLNNKKNRRSITANKGLKDGIGMTVTKYGKQLRRIRMGEGIPIIARGGSSKTTVMTYFCTFSAPHLSCLKHYS